MIDWLIVLVAAGAVVAVMRTSSRLGGRHRVGDVSLRRGPRAHTTSRGRPKVAFASRDDALAKARADSPRQGSRLSAYQCDECGKWHLGH